MINKTRAHKAVAILTAVAMLSLSATVAWGSPGVGGAELSVLGAVAVDGRLVMSGITIFSDCVIVTSPAGSASVSLGKRGRVELSANTNLKLSFAEDRIGGQLVSGTARFSVSPGVLLNLTTRDGVVMVDGKQATMVIVDLAKDKTTVATESGLAELRSLNTTTTIAAGETGTAGVPQSTKQDDHDKHHRGLFWAVLLATGGAVAAVIWIVTHDNEPNDLNFGGTVTVPSG